MLLCVPCLLASCDHNVHDCEGGGGLSVSLAWTDEADKGTEVKDVKLWIFNADDGSPVVEKQYGSAQEVASQRFSLQEGHYRILTTANLVAPYIIGEATRAIPSMNHLMLGLSNPSASPEHVYYGVTDVVIDKEDVRYITKSNMQHILAELTILIEGVPDNFAMIGKVLNVATGLLPLQKNEDGTFGTASYTKEECDIPLRIAVPGETLKTETLRLMPTANGFYTTKLFIQLISPGGVVSNYDIEAPIMKSGGKYKINLEFEEMKPYMYLTSTKIDDWTEGWVYRGEILNPED
ncbi:FimB/Mfa2 family fimbrial subunit [Segatella sp.]